MCYKSSDRRASGSFAWHVFTDFSEMSLHFHNDRFDYGVQVSLLFTVNSLYCGHPRGGELVSLIARVRNSGNLFQSNVCNLFLPGS